MDAIKTKITDLKNAFGEISTAAYQAVQHTALRNASGPGDVGSDTPPPSDNTFNQNTENKS